MPDISRGSLLALPVARGRYAETVSPERFLLSRSAALQASTQAKTLVGAFSRLALVAPNIAALLASVQRTQTTAGSLRSLPRASCHFRSPFLIQSFNASKSVHLSPA